MNNVISSEFNKSETSWAMLWMKPGEFFTNYKFSSNSKAYYVAAALFCLASSIDQMEKNILKGKQWAIEAAGTWLGYWEYVLLGTVFAIIGLAIGVWWYGKRVKIAEGNENSESAKEIYVFSSLIWGIPMVVLTLISTAFLPNALGSNDDFTWIDYLWLLSLLFPLYSVWVSYSGVRVLHPEAKLSKLRLWFLILPMLCYLGWAVLLAVAIANSWLPR